MIPNLGFYSTWFLLINLIIFFCFSSYFYSDFNSSFFLFIPILIFLFHPIPFDQLDHLLLFLIIFYSDFNSSFFDFFILPDLFWPTWSSSPVSRQMFVQILIHNIFYVSFVLFSFSEESERYKFAQIMQCLERWKVCKAHNDIHFSNSPVFLFVLISFLIFLFSLF